MKSTLEKIVVMVAFDQGKKIEITRLFDGCRFKGETTEPTWNWVDFDYDVMVEPAECWVWIHSNGNYGVGNYGVGFNSEQEAKNSYSGASGRAVLMREVIK